MLFINFSSALSIKTAVIPRQSITKLGQVGLSTSLCSWLLDSLTESLKSVRVGNSTSSAITLSTGAFKRAPLVNQLAMWCRNDTLPEYGENRGDCYWLLRNPHPTLNHAYLVDFLLALESPRPSSVIPFIWKTGARKYIHGDLNKTHPYTSTKILFIHLAHLSLRKTFTGLCSLYISRTHKLHICIDSFALLVLMSRGSLKHFDSNYCFHIVVGSDEETELLMKLRSSNKPSFIRKHNGSEFSFIPHCILWTDFKSILIVMLLVLSVVYYDFNIWTDDETLTLKWENLKKKFKVIGINLAKCLLFW